MVNLLSFMVIFVKCGVVGFFCWFVLIETLSFQGWHGTSVLERKNSMAREKKDFKIISVIGVCMVQNTVDMFC